MFLSCFPILEKVKIINATTSNWQIKDQSSSTHEKINELLIINGKRTSYRCPINVYNAVQSRSRLVAINQL